jgi:hypothetical protein
MWNIFLIEELSKPPLEFIFDIKKNPKIMTMLMYIINWSAPFFVSVLTKLCHNQQLHSVLQLKIGLGQNDQSLE